MIRKGPYAREEYAGQKRRRHSFLVGLLVVIVGVVVLAVIIWGVTTMLRVIPGFGRSVGLLTIDGPIYDTRKYVDTLQDFKDSYSVRAIVVRIESPGGSVAGVQELYEEIQKVRKETHKPVIASLGNIAASGGYYVACATQEIFSNPGTVTGSVGVIFEFANMEKLVNKIGLRFEVIKSGEYKDIGSGFRPMTEAERNLLQGVIDDVYEQFLEAILNTRKEKIERAFAALPSEDAESTVAVAVQRGALANADAQSKLRSIADGRILSGRQAQEYGLVDTLGNLQDAIDRAGKLAGIVGKPHVVQPKRRFSIFDLMSGKFGALINQATRSSPSLEYRLINP
jgi:protease-4